MASEEEKLKSRFERKLYGALALLVAVLFTLALYSYRSLVQVNSERSQLTERYSRALALTSDMRYLKAHEDSLVLAVILSGDETLFGQVKDARRQFLELSESLAEVDSSATTKARLQQIRELEARVGSDTDAALTLRAQGSTREETLRAIEKQDAPLNYELNLMLNDLHQRERQEFLKAREITLASTTHLLRGFVLVTLVTGVGFVAIVLLVVNLVRSKQARDEARERLLEQVKRTAQARKEALETVSHDLKNPLSAIELNLQLLQRLDTRSASDSSGAMTVAPVTTALHAAHSMKDLIQALLDQAKMEAGNFELELRHGSLTEIINRAIEILEPLARQKAIRIEAVNLGEIPPVPLDQRRINQVVSNILGNAIKFTPNGGRITIKTEVEKQCVRVSITDTGPGLPKDQLERVFERFWQPSATRKQGTGLGLAIAKGVVDAHGGKIWAESERGHGATFCFLIPMDQPERNSKMPQVA